MRRRSWFPWIWVLGVLLCGDRALTAGAPGCRRVQLDPPPGWANSLAWSAGEREIVITDPLGSRLLRYSREGRLLGEIGKPGGLESNYDYEPSAVHTAPEGLLVRSMGYDWIWLDRQFKFLKSVGQGVPPRFAMIDEVLLRGEVIGFGTLRKPDRTWIFGLQRVRLNPLEVIESLEEIDLVSKGGTLYQSLSPAVAIAGGVPYALRFGEPSWLVNLRTRRPLKTFPQGFEKLPTLPKNIGPDSVISRAQVIQKSTFPVGLYGFGSDLYLLTRKPGEPGKTLWQLHRIDPAKDQLVETVTLSTSTAEIGVLPGKDSWVVFEKEAKTAFNKQKIPSFLLIPTSAIEKGGAIPACK